MANIENYNQFFEKNKKELIQDGSNCELDTDTRKRPFEIQEEKRYSKLLSMIASQLPNIPAFAEQLNRKGEIALDLSQALAEKLTNGEIKFGTYSVSGEKYAQFINSQTGKIFKNIPIKELPIELGTSIAMAGLSMKLQEITNELNVLGKKVDRVNRNFDLNRYAEVQSAKEKYEMAMFIKDFDTKKTLLRESLSQATNAKNLLLNQLLETKFKLEREKTSGKILLLKNTMKAIEGDKLAKTALYNLFYTKDVFSLQIAILYELCEFEALDYVVYEFKNNILKDFSGEDALFLDENLSDSTNPFKFLSNNVVAASNSVIEFLENNGEFL